MVRDPQLAIDAIVKEVEHRAYDGIVGVFEARIMNLMCRMPLFCMHLLHLSGVGSPIAMHEGRP